ncbi:hypothetical protein [Paraferrimonas sedimenticola]|uniref:Lipoprotein n=1 Tax=Paraferrimonas sedimenticola TaxID=375674 RepID=A0AA37RW32_9GAMM|nr:hypothetical protein [Paraferrimonas sedimenticola]GLP95999.1 hypothetical protein GCM10007895_13050 [Paraferrimonas sedimenticola]
MKLKLLLPAVAVLATGCAIPTNPLQLELESLPEADKAYIVGKFITQCSGGMEGCTQRFNSIWASYSNTQLEGYSDIIQSRFGSIQDKDTEYDFIDPVAGEKGFYFCKAIPAGNYALTSFSYYSYGGGGHGFHSRKASPFEIPFSLKKGEVAYLGQLRLTVLFGAKNSLGIQDYQPGWLELATNAEQDISYAVAKCPVDVKVDEVSNKPLNPVLANSPLVISGPASTQQGNPPAK